MRESKVQLQVEEIYGHIAHKKNVVFDWNGTLLDDLDHTLETANYFLAEQNLEVFDRQTYRKHFNFPVKDCYSKLGYDFNLLSYEEMSHQFVDRFMSGVHKTQLFDFVLPLLEMLKANQHKVFLLSATEQNCLDELMEHFRLSGYFDGVYGINNRMAASKVYRGRELLADHQLLHTESLMIGDTLHDLEVANELAMDALLLDHGHHCTTRLVAQHKVVLKWHRD